MIPVLQSSTSTKDWGYLDPTIKAPGVDFTPSRSMHLTDSFTLAPRNSLTDVSNIAPCSPATATDSGISRIDLSSLLSHSHPTIHFGRVVTMDSHDTDAQTHEQRVHDMKLASSSLCSDNTGSNDCFPADVARNYFASMELRTQELWTGRQSLDDARHREDTVSHPSECVSLVASGSGVSPIRPKITAGSCSCDVLSEGRRRVGEILVRCGVIDVTGISPESSVGQCGDIANALPIDSPKISSMAAERLCVENDGLLIPALADWTSEWLHTLVIQPFLQGSRFQYYGGSSRATSVVPRIRRVLSDVNNPVQVAIHALWFISTLTGSLHDNAPFLSVAVFRYLHNNGTFFAEDFMFRTFVACAMIGDKTVNDVTLSTNIWNRLTHIPQGVLNATEKHTLSCLKWNLVMTPIQWQDTIIYLRSCIKMGSVFDPFAYDETSPSGIMARCLDGLIDLSYADEPDTSHTGKPAVEIVAPRPIRHFTHWGVFDTEEWCPEDDPIVNRKPRTIGIAPGADRYPPASKMGTTAKDLLDSILVSSNAASGVTRPRAGTSFCGSFGAIGARLAHTVTELASACQNSSWTHSHGYLATCQ